MVETARTAQSQVFRSRRFAEPYSLDEGPARHRIGLVALASDYTVERDFANMRPGDDVAVYVSRVQNVNPCTVENLRRMGPRITDAVSLIIPDGRLDVVAYACTSGTAVIGVDAVRDSIRAARPGVACTTPMSASLAAFTRLGVSRIAVLTPYLDEVNAVIARELAGHGVEVVAFTSFQIADDNDMARVSPEVVRRAARDADRARAEALFVSCTAVRAVDAAAQVEADLGKPVVTANQALFWQSLRLSGCAAPVAGFGRLLQLGA